MLRWLLGFSLQYRAMVLAGAAALMCLGVYRLRDAPVDVLPEFSAPVIQIQTEALGLSAAEVEDLVTLNLEEILTSVSWLKAIRSSSMTGLSAIDLVFEPGTNVMRARQLVQERLNLAHALPNVSKTPLMMQPLSTTSRAMIIGLLPKDVSLIDASVLARWTIVPKLLGVPGVANVAVWGMRSRQLQVQVDPKQLRDQGVTLKQVVKTAGDAMWFSPLSFLEAATPGAGGWIDTPNQRLGIQHVQPITSSAELAKVAVADAADKSLRLGDVAKVVEEHPPLIGDAIINNNPGLLLVIENFPDANAVEVVRGVNVALNELRQGLPGITIDTSIYRATSFIDLSIENIGSALLLGGGLLILVLAAWFFSWRAALISIVVIPLSLVTAGFVLYLRGITINAMVVAGFAIALAVIIDDAVVDIENIMRRLRRQRSQGDGRSTATIIFEACIETRSAMVYATLILILAVSPLFLLSGPLGAFVSPLAVSYVLAILVSMAVAVLVTPALAMVLLRGASIDDREPPLVRRLQPRYDARPVAHRRRATRGVGHRRRHRAGRSGGPAADELVAVALVQGKGRARRLGRGDRRLAAGNAPDHDAGHGGAAAAAGDPQCRCPYRTRRDRRPGGRRRVGAALGQHRSQGRLRRDAGRHSRHGPGLSRLQCRRADLSQRPGEGSADGQRRAHRGARSGTRAGSAASGGGEGGEDAVGDFRPRQCAPGEPGRDASDRDQGRPRGGRKGRAQARRRSPGGGHRLCRSRGWQSLRAAESIRCRGLGCTRIAPAASPMFAIC